MLREKMVGLSERAVLQELKKNPIHQQMTIKFRNKAPMKPITSHSIMDRIQIDLIDKSNDPAQCGRKRYRYILTVLDVCSRYIWLRPLEKKSSKLVTTELKKIFENYGNPAKVQHDQGSEFRGLLSHYLQQQGIKQIRSSPYHPESQGKVERTHRELKAMIKYDKLTGSKLKWHAMLEKYARILNDRKKPILGHQSPFQVFFGRSRQASAREKKFTPTQRLNIARKATKKLNERLIKRQLHKLKLPYFTKGDRVLCKIPSKISRVTSQLIFGEGIITEVNQKTYKYKVKYTTTDNAHALRTGFIFKTSWTLSKLRKNN